MLARILAPKAEAAYSLLRIVSGLLFAFHGAQILFGLLTDHKTAAGTQIWFGGVIELVTGLAVAAGIFTSGAAFLASGTMAVAYVQFHWKFALDAKFFPAMNQGELALLYAFLFLYIACRAGGGWSLRRRLGMAG